MKYLKIWVLSAVVIFFATFCLDVINVTTFIPLTTNYDWLSFLGAFFGSVLGGFITFISMYITLKQQKSADDEKNRLSIIPILEYKIRYDESDFDNSNGQLSGEIIPHINLEGSTYDDGKSEEWFFHLIVRNVGLGHAQINRISFDFKENGTDKIIQTESVGFNYKLAKKEEYTDFYWLIYAPKDKFLFNGEATQDFLYPLDIIVEYQDLLENKYEQKLYACIGKAVVKNEKYISEWTTAELFYYDNFKLK